MKKALSLLLICLLAAPLAAPARAQNDSSNLASRLMAYRYGGSTAVLDSISEQVSAARGNKARMHMCAHQLALVLGTHAPFEVKQFACRQLAFVASGEQAPALAALLPDEALAHYALMALARIPGKGADDAMLAALPRCHGLPRQEILDTLADRGEPRALPILVAGLRAPDSAEVGAAAVALAKLPDPRAAEALRSAYLHASGASRLACGHALLACAEGMRRRGNASAAWQLYVLLDKSAPAPILRAGALRGMVKTRPATALPLVLQALHEEGTPRQATAADLARQIPGAAATRALSACLLKLGPRGQVMLQAALADRRDSASVKDIATLCRSNNVAVRVAALRALGGVGDKLAVSVLLAAAVSDEPEAREAARDSLTRIRLPIPANGQAGDPVDIELERAMIAGPPTIQAEAVMVLGMRGSREALPKVLQATESREPKVRAAAYHVLRDLGQTGVLPGLVSRMLALPPNDRDMAAAAVSAIARRGTDEDARTGALLQRLSGSPAPADKTTLLTILGQVGGDRALAALRAGLADSNADVRTTALSQLAEWPTDAPLDDLLRYVHATQEPQERTIALRGYLRLMDLNEQRSPEQSLAIYRAITPLATRADDRRIILAGLATIHSHDALTLASSFLSDAEVGPEAETAVVAIGRCTIGGWPGETRAALEQIAHKGANEKARQAAGELLATRDKMGDFVAAWEVSPVYVQQGANCSMLFDIPFAPEEAAHEKEVPWRLMPVCTEPDQPWLLDLLALWGGEQRVAYLRTAVLCDSPCNLNLEMGSDDGVKAWWNGKVVLADNVMRGVSPGQEKVTVSAKAGYNVLLLKITQNNMGWGACARFTHTNGSPAPELKFAVPSCLSDTILSGSAVHF
jgi:HEAT repeat protein